MPPRRNSLQTVRLKAAPNSGGSRRVTNPTLAVKNTQQFTTHQVVKDHRGGTRSAGDNPAPIADLPQLSTAQRQCARLSTSHDTLEWTNIP